MSKIIHNRDEIAYNEATRDPIFLFQTKRFIRVGDIPEEPNNEYPFYYDVDNCEVVYSPEHEKEGCSVPMDELESYELFASYWETRSVWGTRHEAEDYGKSRSYEWPDGYRVYCTVCNGLLAEFLKENEFLS